MKLFFKIAGVYFDNGQLIINSVETRPSHKHYDVEVEVYSDHSVKVIAHKATYNISLYEEPLTVDEIPLYTKKSIVWKKKWPWSKERTQPYKACWAECTARDRYTYEANNYIIVQS